MIARNAAASIRAAAQAAPVVAILGPRQSGKSTLCRHLFGDRPLVSLEAPDQRTFATEDPRGFLAQYRAGAVFDEVQRAPELASYLQELVDEDPRHGRFILTGSESLTLRSHLSQSLAGRVRLVEVLPCSFDEIERFANHPTDLSSALWTGGYPRIFDQKLDAPVWLGDYVRTYVERDVRQIVNVADLGQFQTFLALTAGRSAQLLNASSLGAEAGLTHTTVRRWLSILETCFITYSITPYFRNLGKRLTKAPKLHFWDSGLLCYLLGIRSPSELVGHPLRGAIFESWVVSETRKHLSTGSAPRTLHFYRDQSGHEVDLLIDLGRTLLAVECKSGATLSREAFDELDYFASAAAAQPLVRHVDKAVLFGGEKSQLRSDREAISWQQLAPWFAEKTRA